MVCDTTALRVDKVVNRRTRGWWNPAGVVFLPTHRIPPHGVWWREDLKKESLQGIIDRATMSVMQLLCVGKSSFVGLRFERKSEKLSQIILFLSSRRSIFTTSYNIGNLCVRNMQVITSYLTLYFLTDALLVSLWNSCECSNFSKMHWVRWCS